MDFDGLVDKYEKPVFNLIYRLIGDREEAADLTQDTFVAAYKSFQKFRGESSFYTWLYRIAVNLCKNKFNERDRRRIYEGPSLDNLSDEKEAILAFDKTTDADAPDLTLQRKELKEYIERAIMQLPPDYRIVAVLRDLHGLSYSEIAAATDMSIDVVKTRVARARGMLRQKLSVYLSE